MSGPFSQGREDRLYDLLPAVYRQRDEEQGFPLRELLRVVAEQVNAVEDDIAQLYENWFIETCQDWVVPYLGDLIGYRPVHEAGEAGSLAGRQRNRILTPRREVGHTLRNRRRKGTLALLESLAADVAGWPARAVELYRLVAFNQWLHHPQLRRGRTVDLRRGEDLDRLGGPFDRLAHTADLRRVASRHLPGRPNLPGVGLFLWRLRSYPVTGTLAYCVEAIAPNFYTFSVLGNDAPLYGRPAPEAEPTEIAEEVNLPVPLRRRTLAAHTETYYGVGKSLQIFRVVLPGPKRKRAAADLAPALASAPSPDAFPGPIPDSELLLELVPAHEIVIADLSGWRYQPRKGQVAVDPELGRIAFPPRHLPKNGIRVSYHYGFSADLGGGEYDRPVSQPAGEVIDRSAPPDGPKGIQEVVEGQPDQPVVFLYRVGPGKDELASLNAALLRWRDDRPRHAVIEISDSGVYVEPVLLDPKLGQTLQLRAARRRRPILRLLDWQTARPDALTIEGEPGSEVVLDGLLVAGRGIQVRGELAALTLRHSTLVPGWSLHGDCEPHRPAEASLELCNLSARVVVEHSIVGAIRVNQDEVATDPIDLRLSDSLIDGTGDDSEALSAPGCLPAHARLTVQRCTVFGEVLVHALALGEDSIFTGRLRVARRQLGCLRFSSVVPGSRTPRRFECQPDLAEAAALVGLANEPEREAARALARHRVRPSFRSRRYGSPLYGRLADDCAEEVRRGAEDESEMGVFHDLYEPQRAANLRARLDEYTPAGVDAGLIFADQEAS